MSITRISSIHCDNCGQWSYGTGVTVEGTAVTIRRELQIFGWRQVGRLDYCPNCAYLAARGVVKSATPAEVVLNDD